MYYNLYGYKDRLLFHWKLKGWKNRPPKNSFLKTFHFPRDYTFYNGDIFICVGMQCLNAQRFVATKRFLYIYFHDLIDLQQGQVKKGIYSYHWHLTYFSTNARLRYSCLLKVKKKSILCLIIFNLLYKLKLLFLKLNRKLQQKINFLLSHLFEIYRPLKAGWTSCFSRSPCVNLHDKFIWK